jgi:hypothetical protein
LNRLQDVMKTMAGGQLTEPTAITILAFGAHVALP